MVINAAINPQKPTIPASNATISTSQKIQDISKAEFQVRGFTEDPTKRKIKNFFSNTAEITDILELIGFNPEIRDIELVKFITGLLKS